MLSMPLQCGKHVESEEAADNSRDRPYSWGSFILGIALFEALTSLVDFLVFLLHRDLHLCNLLVSDLRVPTLSTFTDRRIYSNSGTSDFLPHNCPNIAQTSTRTPSLGATSIWHRVAIRMNICIISLSRGHMSNASLDIYGPNIWGTGYVIEMGCREPRTIHKKVDPGVCGSMAATCFDQ